MEDKKQFYTGQINKLSEEIALLKAKSQKMTVFLLILGTENENYGEYHE